MGYTTGGQQRALQRSNKCAQQHSQHQRGSPSPLHHLEKGWVLLPQQPLCRLQVPHHVSPPRTGAVVLAARLHPPLVSLREAAGWAAGAQASSPIRGGQQRWQVGDSLTQTHRRSRLAHPPTHPRTCPQCRRDGGPWVFATRPAGAAPAPAHPAPPAAASCGAQGGGWLASCVLRFKFRALQPGRCQPSGHVMQLQLVSACSTGCSIHRGTHSRTHPRTAAAPGSLIAGSLSKDCCSWDTLKEKATAISVHPRPMARATALNPRFDRAMTTGLR